MISTSVRLLVVDDYEPFRRLVCSMLGQRPELQVIGEASDGLEAVQKAEALQPDLIVLDIGLPTLNGIESARRIRKLSPKSKILFLSQETLATVVREAFSAGGLGYIVKDFADDELLAAVDAVCQGRKFVSRGLADHISEDAPAHDVLGPNGALLSPAPGIEGTTRSHEAQFYLDDASFLAGMTHFIEGALKAGNAAILVATESHRNSIFRRLQAHGVDTAAAIETGLYIPLDVDETLATILVDDLPDKTRFLKVTGDLLATAAKAARGEHTRVAACGEGAPTLWARGRADAAIQLEQLWDEIARTHNVDRLCGYVLEILKREQESDIYERICAEHSAVGCQ